MEGQYGKVTYGLKDSIQNGLAKRAKEQEVIAYSWWIEIYYFLPAKKDALKH